jgi:hypothetical protein
MRHIIFLFSLLITFHVFSQCTYDENCTISPAFPTICPSQLPDATVGELYNADLTFWMPVQFEAEGFTVNFDQLVVTQITGLPLGMSVELSNSSMVYYPSESEYGCASVSGVPLVAGDYIITVSIVANVTVEGVGFEVPYPEDFDLFLTVNPGSGGNTSFIYSPSSGCEDLNVSFEALITSDSYDVEYVWDFDNGYGSNQQFPPTQLYDQPGQYNVTLTTNLTSNVFTLNNFGINYTDVNCWGFDIEEACIDFFGAVECWGDPDLLIKVYDGNGNLVYQTDYITGTTASWPNMNFTLNNPPYTVSIWDTEEWDDLGGVQLSDNDELATFSLNLEAGNHSFNSNCSSGTYTISAELVNVQSIEASELVTVFEQPDLETILNEDLYVVYVDYSNAVSYQWFLDGEAVDGATEASYIVDYSGTYFVEFVTEDGCFGMSIPLDVVKCDNNFSPSIFVSDLTLLTTDTEYNLDWYWNGIYYGEGSDVNVNVDGYYWVIASDEYGCFWSSDTIFYQSPIIDDIDNDGIDNEEDEDVDGDGIVNSEDDDVDGDGIPNDIDNDIDGDGITNENDDTISGFLFLAEALPSSLLVFPNPSNGIFGVKFLDSNLHNKSAKIILRDINGKLVFEEDVNSSLNNINVSWLPSSTYYLKIYIEQVAFSKTIVIQ